jgi:hypothetical protein
LQNGMGNSEGEEGGVDFALGNVLRLMLFTSKKDTSHEREQLSRIAESLDKLGTRLETLEGKFDLINKRQVRSCWNG